MTTWYADELLSTNGRTGAADVAVVDADGALTWAALDARASGVAVRVREAGVLPGERVAISGPASARMVAAILGVLRAGAVAAPLPGGLTARERDVALEILAPALILDAGPPPPVGGGVVPPAARDPEEPAIVVLTSGTTGRPKGVVLSARAMAASADAWLAALPPATGWVLPLGLGHVAGLGAVWRAIRQGVPVRLVAPADPGALLAALRDGVGGHAASHVSVVPSQLARVLDAAADAPPPATLRAVLLGGGVIAPELVVRAARAGWPVVPTYGLSEMGSGVTALPAGEAATAAETAGRPLAGVTLAIDAPGPDGVGEIVVSGPARCSGYLGELAVTPDATLRTGDLGRLDDLGRLVVVDRRTDRIVRGGENVDPSEVEAVLEAHPAVREAAVVGRSDAFWGHVPVAALVLEAGAADPGDEAIATFARSSLAGFKVPGAFVRLDALPRTPGGKLRRDAVRALVAGEPAGILARPGGDAIGWRVTGSGPRDVVLLHGTLSNAAQLDRFAAALAAGGDVTVHALDRRGSGSSRLAEPRPLDVAVHLADLAAYLDARGIERAAFVGVSFGGVLALEAAARMPGRVEAVAAYEPPYGLVADADLRGWFADVARATADAHAAGGAAAASETFLRAVAGDAAWDRLHERGRAFLAREGDGALADSGLTGLDPDGLARIAAPVLLLTGGASEPFYAPIADALVARIPGARRATLDGLAHPAPITDPGPVAMAVLAFLELSA